MNILVTVLIAVAVLAVNVIAIYAASNRFNVDKKIEIAFNNGAIMAKLEGIDRRLLRVEEVLNYRTALTPRRRWYEKYQDTGISGENGEE